MLPDETPRLKLPYLIANQAQKHVTLNEALGLVDALLHASAQSRTLAAQPADPGEGQAWLLPAGRAGPDWSLHPPDTLLRHEAGAWTPVEVPVGALVFVVDEGRFLVRAAAGWIALGSALGEAQGLDRLGVGAAADAVSRFVVRADAAWLSARPAAEGGSGSHRLTVNRTGGGDTASIVFASGWSGRAEAGLAGDDRFSIKVSADGSAWRTALSVDAVTGFVGVGQAAPVAPLDVAHASATPVLRVFRTAEDNSPSSVSVIRARGTAAAPAPIKAGDRFFAFFGQGWTTGGASGGNAVGFLAVAEEDFAPTAMGTAINFETCPKGGAARRAIVRFRANGTLHLIPMAAAPADPEAGQLYFDQTTGKFRGWTGTAWADLN